VAWDKPGGFIGRDALMRRREAGPPRRRLVQVRLDDPSRLLHHDEPIWQGGRIVGAITSGAFGHRIEASLGMGYVTAEEPVTADLLAAGGFEVEVAWERVPARLQLRPWYDPEGRRIRA
jgi:glycine cleavage system aminomethyltransferase T